MRQKCRITFILWCIATAGTAYAQQIKSSDQVRVDAAMRAAFPTASASANWLSRLTEDQTMQVCSQDKDAPPPEQARAIAARESASIQYPPNDKLSGDWKRGEQVAQSGYGLRFTDYPPTRENG